MSSKIHSILVVFVLFTTIICTSCRSESDELITTSETESLIANSKTANLILRTSMNNSSGDDNIDDSDCFSIKIPFTITANGQEVTINSQEDVDKYDDIFDDTDEIVFSFPITVVFNDFSEEIVTNQDQLNEISNNCNTTDDMISCIDFEYPFSASVFDSQSELINTVTFENDKDLYRFVEDLEDTDVTSINFPITVVFSDDSRVVINGIDDLEDAIEDVVDEDCDDDDDDDDNNGDDTSMDVDSFSQILVDEEWEILKYKDNQSNETKNYKDFEFDFLNDGSVVIEDEENDETINGTWSASKNADEKLEVNFDFGSEAPLDKLNGLWEVKKAEEEQIKLERDDDGVSKDQLFFKED